MVLAFRTGIPSLVTGRLGILPCSIGRLGPSIEEFSKIMMTRTSSLLAFTLGLAPVFLSSTHAASRLLEMPRPTDAEIHRMRESGVYEFLEVGETRALAVEDTELLAKISEGKRREVQMMRSAYRIQNQNLDDVFASFKAKGSEGDYHSFAEVQAEIQELAAANSDRVTLQEIGRSYEDRPITAVRIGANDGVERPAAIFMGMIHAREWISTEMAMAFLHNVIHPSADLAPVLENVTVYVIPVLNPDGLIWSQTNYKWWRGNRRVNKDGSIGVDLNRNFTTGWGIGSSATPGSQTYRGEKPLSEPESRAFDAFVGKIKPVATMTWHAYGKMVLLPFGYKGQWPARKDKYDELGPAMQAASGGYVADAIFRLIGIVGGSTDDHFLVEHGAWVATLELGRSFVPPESMIEQTIAEGMPAAMVWLKAVPGLAGIDPRVPATAKERAFQALH